MAKNVKAQFLKKREHMLNGKNILITGGTGSFGKAFTKYVLKKYNPNKVVILSRDEMKQWDMAKDYSDDPRIRFLIGDVRDKARLSRAFKNMDYIIHAAATKIVPTAESDPIECIKTNINGAINVVDCAIDCGVEKVIALSTDKASSPCNLYGGTKLVSDKLFIASNAYTSYSTTKFSVVRYGNVMGSRGSVLPLFMDQKEHGEVTITDERMTRFMITLEQGVELVLTALSDPSFGNIYVRKIPSMNIVDIAETVAPLAKKKIIGIRAGEKLHEQMIGAEDANFTYDCGEHYVIVPGNFDWYDKALYAPDIKKVPELFTYSSDDNAEWMSRSTLQNFLKTNWS